MNFYKYTGNGETLYGCTSTRAVADAYFEIILGGHAGSWEMAVCDAIDVPAQMIESDSGFVFGDDDTVSGIRELRA